MIGVRGEQQACTTIFFSALLSLSTMSSVLSSGSLSCSCSRPGATLASAAAGTCRGSAVPARQVAPKKQGRSSLVDRRPSPSTSTSSTTAAAAAKRQPLILPSLPSLSLPKFYLGGAKLSKAKAKLLNLISKSERGTNPQGPSRVEIETAIDELYAAAPRSALFPLENNPAGIDGKWKLVSCLENGVLKPFLEVEREHSGGKSFEKKRRNSLFLLLTLRLSKNETKTN